MKNTEANLPVDLSTMLGSSDEFEVNGKSYEIKPILLKDIDQFMKDNVCLGAQIFSVSNKTSRNKLNFWLSKYCFDDKGEPLSIDKVMDLEWSVVDLKKFIQKLCDLSG
jgi:hypothetical protein